MATPEELEQQARQEARQRQILKTKLALQKTLAIGAAVGGIQQLSGLDKINQSINSKVESLKSKALDQLFNLANDLGIEGLETGVPTLPDLCPSPAILTRALQIRNNLGGSIETTAAYINIVDNSLQIVSDLLNGTITGLTALNLLKLASSAATKVLPTAPGAVTALLADLDDVRTLITFKTDGTPKLPELKRAVDNGAAYISKASTAINTILQLLSFIDQVLIKCGQNPNNLGENTDKLINKAKQAVDNTLYKGFTFRIVEKAFSPTVNQKIGQALNSQGIVLLETEPSFTLDPQVLIEELKLIIDRDNLKAN